MRNPIHKRLERFESWQHLAFMTALCERMQPNFALFWQLHGQDYGRVYHNILNLVWEYLTVKGAKINFESQLEKFEDIIPNVNDFDEYGVFPAVDAAQALSELLHALISGEMLSQSILVSQISLKTVAELLEAEQDRTLNEQELKASSEIEEELDLQWSVYRALNDAEERDLELLNSLKNELRGSGISNIGIKIDH
ncbi:DUF416 family protein [Pasteurellaceae bacterium 20609_3]|uniref:YjaG family protein n=1 Tax=Spirabiliibacterium mucosae TaxID=28156 RepID=UPI001AACE74F|nr:DUF416 family protein [Spirabiliibacterium mucosae]MBE2899168.1 DUF416 family protein [Spirabiliibacterium mucosae]